MSTITTNLGLIKPELTDAADITAMNENWDKIDEQLSNIDDTIERTLENITPESIGAHSLRSVAVGSVSTHTAGWYKVGSIPINAAYTTYSAMLAIQSNSTRGVGIMQLTIRTDDVAGVLNSGDSQLVWISRYQYMPIGVFAIDASDGQNAILYVYINGNYQTYHVSILAEKLGGYDVTDTPDKQLLKLVRNHGEASAVNMKASITQSLTSKDTNMYYTYGQTDLTAGSSDLGTGKLYLVYE